MAGTLKLTVTFGLADPALEYRTNRVDPNASIGLQPDDLHAYQRSSQGLELSTDVGSQGVGASGPAIDLVITIAEHSLADIASLIAVGSGVSTIIAKVLARRKRSVTVKHPTTAGALSAAAAADQLAGSRYVGTYLHGSAGLGVDARQVWASVYSNDQAGYQQIVFLSGSGIVLGQVRVPTEMVTSEFRLRDATEISQLFAAWNGCLQPDHQAVDPRRPLSGPPTGPPSDDEAR